MLRLVVVAVCVKNAKGLVLLLALELVRNMCLAREVVAFRRFNKKNYSGVATASPFLIIINSMRVNPQNNPQNNGKDSLI